MFGVSCWRKNECLLLQTLTQENRISTLGAENSGGSLVVINLHELLNFDPNRTVLSQNIYEIATFNCTVWTTDCESDGSHAVIGKYYSCLSYYIVNSASHEGGFNVLLSTDSMIGDLVSKYKDPVSQEISCADTHTHREFFLALVLLLRVVCRVRLKVTVFRRNFVKDYSFCLLQEPTWELLWWIWKLGAHRGCYTVKVMFWHNNLFTR